MNQNGLTAGTYNLIVSDDNGCSIQQEIVLDEPTEITITENISDYNGYQVEVSCNGAQMEVIYLHSIGTGVFTYSWSNGESAQDLTNSKGFAIFLPMVD